MIHAIQCNCFNCKNGYTPIKDRAVDTTRKYRKPTGKRPNRTRKIEIKNALSKADIKEFGQFMNFWRNI